MIGMAREHMRSSVQSEHGDWHSQSDWLPSGRGLPEGSGLWVKEKQREALQARGWVADHWDGLGYLAFLSLFQHMCILKVSFIFLSFS